MKKILTGLQPTGVITLGNYIGAIKQMVKNQEEYESYIFIADLHAITIPIDREELRKNIRSLVALYLACGIDPEKNVIFIQSENEWHANISWLLECNTYFGELSRMTQFKDKSKKNANFSAGLFTYPVLMASDILAYDVDYVPVGIDQKQHVEIARDIAIRFNKKYGEVFKIPDVMISDSGTKIMDLVNPEKKMSKSSDNPKGVIKLLDDLDVIRKNNIDFDTPCNGNGSCGKCRCRLRENIYSALTGLDIKEVENKFLGYNYGDFKKEVSEVVVEEVAKIQERYEEILESSYLDEVLNQGALKTREIAKNKYFLMKERIGLGR